MTRASVVLPVPGGPQRMIDWSRSRSMASRSGLPGARIASCPTTSSSVRGRMRSASGVPGALRSAVSPEPRGAKVDPRRGGCSHGFIALPTRRVDQNGAGNGDIERIHRGGHRNGDARTAARDDVAAQARPFAADEQADGSAPVDARPGRRRRAAPPPPSARRPRPCNSSPPLAVMPATTGSRSALPMLPRSAFHENGLADAPQTKPPLRRRLRPSESGSRRYPGPARRPRRSPARADARR